MEQALGVVGGEEGKDDDTDAGGNQIKGTVAPEHVDHARDDEADEQHEECAPHGAEVALGECTVERHAAEHARCAPEGQADGMAGVGKKKRPDEQPFDRRKDEKEHGKRPGGEHVAAEAHDTHDADGTNAEHDGVLHSPADGIQ